MANYIRISLIARRFPVRVRQLFSAATVVAFALAISAAACGSDAPAADTTTQAASPERSASTPTRPMAPDFSLPSAFGNTVTLDDLLEGSNAAVLVFYRGFF